MSHLKASEIIDAIDGVLAPDRNTHAVRCVRCRDEIERAAAAVEVARGAALPSDEPSPLFWDHFSVRVRAAIDAESPSGTRAWRLWVPAAALMTVAVTVALGTIGQDRDPHGSLERPFAANAPAATSITAAVPTDASDDSWALVAETAEELDWDAAATAGLGVGPGAADNAVLQLSDDQQQELARLLESELGRNKSRG